MRNSIFLVIVLSLSSCASRIPLDIRTAPTFNPTPSAVIGQADAFKNRPVRWGGTVLSVANHEKDSEIEILAEDLDRSGKPVGSDASRGRFLARVEGFIDPAVYAQGRSLTVYGWVDSVIRREIGQKPYDYPVIRVKTLYLWPREPEYAYRSYYPYYYPYGFRYGLGYGFHPHRFGYGFGFHHGHYRH